MCHRLMFTMEVVHHLKINESSIRIIIKKEKEVHEITAALLQQV